MIEISLHPKTIFIDQETQVLLRLFNRGPGVCLDLRLEFRFSPEIFVIKNGRRIDCEFLEEGKWYDREITVIARQVGSFILTSESFLYDDGQNTYKKEFSIPIQVVPVTRPVAPQVSLGEAIFNVETRPNKVNLRNNLRKHFSLSDLRDITFELDINYESLDHTRLDEFTRELVRYCERHGKLERLLQVCRKERPFVDWG